MADVILTAVRAEQASTLANLLELYCHDLSIYFPISIGSDGRYGYPHLAQYFSEPGKRHAYFIEHDRKLSGFALATRGSSAAQDPNDLDVAEFFVLRSHRRHGVGERAAGLLWSELRGHWVVRVASHNEPALAFWRRAIQRYTGHGPVGRTLMLGGMERTLFELDSR